MSDYPVDLDTAQFELRRILRRWFLKRNPNVLDLRVGIALWNADDPSVGIRVAEVGFSHARKASNGLTGSSFGQDETDVNGGSAYICHLVERCLLYRVVGDTYTDQREADIQAADDALLEALNRDDSGTVGSHITIMGDPCDGFSIYGPFPNGEAATNFGERFGQSWWVTELVTPV